VCMKRYLAVTFAGLLLAGCDYVAHGPMQHETRSIPLEKAEVTRVDLKMGAGELTVMGGSSNLLDATFDYNVAAWKPTVNYRSTGARGDLEISQPEGGGRLGGHNQWDLRLNESALMDVSAKLGAGEAKMNLGDLNLRSVEMNIGVGEVTVDLRGRTPARSYDVRINGGVGQANVHLPRDVAIDATAQGGLGEVLVQGLEKRGDRWVNAAKLDAPVTIRVDVKGGIGEIRLVAD